MKQTTDSVLLPALAGRNVFDYARYWALFGQLVEEGRTTGEPTEGHVEFTKLNYKRSERIQKTFSVPEDVAQLAQSLKERITWLVLTEPWCGDAAQCLPYIQKVAAASKGMIELKLLLRDENLDIMDQFLTGGARSIPKLIAVNAAHTVLYTWGPRPAEAQQILLAWKAEGTTPKSVFYERLHGWYAKNRGAQVLEEITSLLKSSPL